MNVLVVEDEPISSKLACVVLSTAGHVVSGAGGANQALAAIKRTRPDVILMDLALPGEDGLTLARRLRQDPETCNVAIIAVTAYPNWWSRQDALKAGCDDYIVKPIPTRTLVDDVARVVAKRGK